MTQQRYSAELLAQARELHSEIIVLDSHLDLPLTYGEAGEEFDKNSGTQFDLVKATMGALSGAVLTVNAMAGRLTEEDMEKGAAQLETRFEIIAGLGSKHSDKVGIALDPDGFRKLRSDRKFGIIIGFQNAMPLGHDLDQIDKWSRRGVQQFGFSFIGNNQWADSARPYPYFGKGFRSSGLSELGKSAVRRLNDLGVMVDVSQLSSEALRDVLATSRAPVLASHSDPRSFADIDRNLDDGELRAIADTGGVVQIVAFAPYLERLNSDMLANLGKLWGQYGLEEPRTLSDALSINDPVTAGWDEDVFWEFLHEFHVVLDLPNPTATVSSLVDAIDHAVKTIGIDHVGIASDFNHSGGVVGWMHSGETLNVTAELLSRGYPKADIAKLWGENYLRVWQQAKDGALPSV